MIPIEKTGPRIPRGLLKRNFSAPVSISTSEQRGLSIESQIDVLFEHSSCRIVSFSTKVRSISSASTDLMPYRSPTERTLATGFLQITLVKAHGVAFVQSGDVVRHLLRRSQAWPVSDSKIILKVGMNDFWRLEVHESDAKHEKFLELSHALRKVIQFDSTPSPFTFTAEEYEAEKERTGIEELRRRESTRQARRTVSATLFHSPAPENISDEHRHSQHRHSHSFESPLKNQDTSLTIADWNEPPNQALSEEPNGTTHRNVPNPEIFKNSSDIQTLDKPLGSKWDSEMIFGNQGSLDFFDKSQDFAVDEVQKTSTSLDAISKTESINVTGFSIEQDIEVAAHMSGRSSTSNGQPDSDISVSYEILVPPLEREAQNSGQVEDPDASIPSENGHYDEQKVHFDSFASMTLDETLVYSNTTLIVPATLKVLDNVHNQDWMDSSGSPNSITSEDKPTPNTSSPVPIPTLRSPAFPTCFIEGGRGDLASVTSTQSSQSADTSSFLTALSSPKSTPSRSPLESRASFTFSEGRPSAHALQKKGSATLDQSTQADMFQDIHDWTDTDDVSTSPLASSSPSTVFSSCQDTDGFFTAGNLPPLRNSISKDYSMECGSGSGLVDAAPKSSHLLFALMVQWAARIAAATIRSALSKLQTEHEGLVEDLSEDEFEFEDNHSDTSRRCAKSSQDSRWECDGDCLLSHDCS